MVDSEEAKNYCNNFDSLNAVVCLHLVLAYTVRLAIMNAAELERNDCFSLPFIRECCVVIGENIDTKLSDGISYQIWYKRC